MLDVDKLKTLIADGKIQETLLILRQIRDQSLQNEVFHLNARYTRYKEAERLQLKSSTELNIELNNLNKAVLEQIDHCAENGLLNFLPNNRIKKKERKIKWVLLLLGLVLFLIIVNNLDELSRVGGKVTNSPPIEEKEDSSELKNITTKDTLPPRKPLKIRKFEVVVRDGILDTLIEGASISIDDIVKQTQRGKAQFELSVHSLDAPIKIRVEKEGFNPQTKLLSSGEDGQEFKLIKYENN